MLGESQILSSPDMLVSEAKQNPIEIFHLLIVYVLRLEWADLYGVYNIHKT